MNQVQAAAGIFSGERHAAEKIDEAHELAHENKAIRVRCIEPTQIATRLGRVPGQGLIAPPSALTKVITCRAVAAEDPSAACLATPKIR